MIKLSEANCVPTNIPSSFLLFHITTILLERDLDISIRCDVSKSKAARNAIDSFNGGYLHW